MHLLTAEQFADQKYDLPEGGRWSELHAGEIHTLDPPDEAHGNVVLNLSKAIAVALRTAQHCHACFELGLIVARSPDTVFCPPISCFQGLAMFAEADKVATDSIPVLVVEVASTPARRQGMLDRVRTYMNSGVETVWVCDPHETEIHCISRGKSTVQLQEHQTLWGGRLMPDLELPVHEVFAEPRWYRGL